MRFQKYARALRMYVFEHPIIRIVPWCTNGRIFVEIRRFVKLVKKPVFHFARVLQYNTCRFYYVPLTRPTDVAAVAALAIHRRDRASHETYSCRQPRCRPGNFGIAAGIENGRVSPPPPTIVLVLESVV